MTVIVIFAVASVFAASITSLVLSSTALSVERGHRAQAYLTAKSVLNASVRHLEGISDNRGEISKFIGKTAAGELPDMGEYTAVVEWSGQNAIKITVTGRFKDQSSKLTAFVDLTGGGG